jgi:hypothetical protein
MLTSQPPCEAAADLNFQRSNVSSKDNPFNPNNEVKDELRVSSHQVGSLTNGDPSTIKGVKKGDQGGVADKINDYETKEADIIHDLYSKHFVSKKGREPKQEPLIGSTVSSKLPSKSRQQATASGEYQTLPDGSEAKILSQYLGTGVPSPIPHERSYSVQNTERLTQPPLKHALGEAEL